MKIREKIQVIHVIMLILGIALLTGFICLAVYFLRTNKYSADLSYSLESIDALIRNENYDAAVKNLESMRFNPEYRGDWLRLLKRCRILAERLDKSYIFSDMAVRAYNHNPRDEEITAITLAALLASQKTGDAVALAAKLDSLEFRSFAAEAYLRQGVQPKTQLHGELIYTALPVSKDPLKFISAGELSGNTGFFLNAALLLLEEDNKKQALSILEKQEIGKTYPYLMALVLYDSFKFEESESYWDLLSPIEKMQTRSLALRADTFLRQRKYADSENVYKIFHYNYPQYSPISYLAANYLKHKKNPFSGLEILRRGLEFFPLDTQLLMEYAKSLIALNQKTEASRITAKIFSAASGSFLSRETEADSRVLDLIGQMGEIPQGRIVSELWLLRNDYPDSASVPDFLRWHLFSRNEFPAIRLLLSDTEAVPFNLSYLAALDFAEGGLFDAENKLLKEISLFPESGESYYNLGLVYFAMKSPEKAISAFENSHKLFKHSRNSVMEEKTQQWLQRLKKLEAYQK